MNNPTSIYSDSPHQYHEEKRNLNIWGLRLNFKLSVCIVKHCRSLFEQKQKKDSMYKKKIYLKLFNKDVGNILFFVKSFSLVNFGNSMFSRPSKHVQSFEKLLSISWWNFKLLNFFLILKHSWRNIETMLGKSFIMFLYLRLSNSHRKIW